MDLTWLEDYLALAEKLNFSRAAEARNVTQPAFSRRIRALEEWAGTPLFVRTTHGVSLTAAGEHFRGHAEALVRNLHQLRRETLEVADGKSAALSFAATHALSFTFFPKWIRRHEHIAGLGAINLISDSMQACEQIMLRGDASFLLCHYHRDAHSRFEPEQFASVIVGTDTLVPLTAPDGKGRARWSLAGADRARYLAYSAESGLGRIISASSTAADQITALDQVFTSHLAATLLSMARSGDGIAWLPRTLAEQDIEAGRLVEAGPAAMAIPVDIRLFRPAARLSPAAETLWALLVEETA
ncbi:MAG: LysR family transcriptional regulator [Dongiaceae bacterium]